MLGWGFNLFILCEALTAVVSERMGFPDNQFKTYAKEELKCSSPDINKNLKSSRDFESFPLAIV